ncbi:ribosomal protein S9/S16-domain-containing protein [Phlebopus sp. FC_14]|nr:ribosomal protein S9/S16-domain-containing protein [Phlebopus sp. FC_14]
MGSCIRACNMFTMNTRRLMNQRPLHLRTFTNAGNTSQTFVPPASLEHVENEKSDRTPQLLPPPSPTFYTTRPGYHDTVESLQQAIRLSRSALRAHHLLPLPPFALRVLPPLEPAWASQIEMGAKIDGKLTATMYRRIMTLLKELEMLQRIARVAGVEELEGAVGNVIGIFESYRGIEARKRRILKREMAGKKADLDQYGRSYTVGRRKTSAARVWMIAVKPEKDGAAQTKTKTKGTSNDLLASPSSSISPPPTSSILINSAPMSTYFPLPADRERVLRPLKLAGLLGSYNVFALVRGGGSSGQSGALALAIAKGCVAHVPEVEPILNKAQLMRRDPRMVERKKTGLAKSRKRYTWIKR